MKTIAIAAMLALLSQASFGQKTRSKTEADKLHKENTRTAVEEYLAAHPKIAELLGERQESSANLVKIWPQAFVGGIMFVVEGNSSVETKTWTKDVLEGSEHKFLFGEIKRNDGKRPWLLDYSAVSSVRSVDQFEEFYKQTEHAVVLSEHGFPSCQAEKQWEMHICTAQPDPIPNGVYCMAGKIASTYAKYRLKNFFCYPSAAYFSTKMYIEKFANGYVIAGTTKGEIGQQFDRIRVLVRENQDEEQKVESGYFIEDVKRPVDADVFQQH